MLLSIDSVELICGSKLIISFGLGNEIADASIRDNSTKGQSSSLYHKYFQWENRRVYQDILFLELRFPFDGGVHNSFCNVVCNSEKKSSIPSTQFFSILDLTTPHTALLKRTCPYTEYIEWSSIVLIEKEIKKNGHSC